MVGFKYPYPFEFDSAQICLAVLNAAGLLRPWSLVSSDFSKTGFLSAVTSTGWTELWMRFPHRPETEWPTLERAYSTPFQLSLSILSATDFAWISGSDQGTQALKIIIQILTHGTGFKYVADRFPSKRFLLKSAFPAEKVHSERKRSSLVLVGQ